MFSTLHDEPNQGMPSPPMEHDSSIPEPHQERLPPRRRQLSALLGGRAGGTILALCVFAGSTLGLLVVPRAARPPETPAMAPALTFLGRPLAAATATGVDPSPQMRATIRGLVRSLLETTFTVTVKGNSSVAMPLSKWGVSIDEARLDRMISDSMDPTSPQFELLQGEGDARGDSAGRALPLVVEVDYRRAASHLEMLKEAVDRPPRSAKFDVVKGQIIQHEDGIALDVLGSVLALKEAVRSGRDKVEASVVVSSPRRTARELAQLTFPKVLGHFDTRYSQSERYADRTYNLRRAAQQLDGTVLFPGEEFDFNQVVGARDEARGYKVATVIEDGELVDGIGGGTCQISGTLHGAVFFSGLEILERYPHTRPSSYIKMGMDATVVYPTINFRFKNPFDFPVVVHQTVEDGRVYAEIRGGNVDQVISLIRKIDSAIPYEQLERPDAKLPRGSRVLAQRGVPGFHLHRYRVVRNGSHTRREKWRDIYPPTAQIVRIGTGPVSGTEKLPAHTASPEYTADEVLVLTLRRAADGTPGDFAENRESGRFGESGWTQAAGMPFWNDG